jgi:hypothetical protein
MNYRSFCCSIGATAVIALVPAAQAHHAIAGNFDMSEHITLENAVLTDFRFVNPHVYIYVDVPGDDGTNEAWRCEMSAANHLRKRGWSAETLLPGQVMRVDGSPARREANVCHVGVITLPDGTELSGSVGRPSAELVQGTLVLAEDAESRPRYLPNGQRNLEGPWVATVDSLDMTSVDATPEGAQAGAGLVRHFDSPALRCEPTNIVLDWIFEREQNRITQSADTVTLHYGYLEQVRTVHLDQTEHPEDLVPSRLGHSIGRWDGDVLVVDTIGFEPGVFDYAGELGFTMHSSEWHVVERFSVSDDGLVLNRDYTFTDPLYMESSYGGHDTASLTDEPLVPYNCEELSGENNRR